MLQLSSQQSIFQRLQLRVHAALTGVDALVDRFLDALKVPRLGTSAGAKQGREAVRGEGERPRSN
jgi:hypothetical protein